MTSSIYSDILAFPFPARFLGYMLAPAHCMNFERIKYISMNVNARSSQSILILVYISI